MSISPITMTVIPKYAKDAPSISACGRFSKVFLNVMSKAWKIAKVAIPIILAIGVIVLGIRIILNWREYTPLETTKSFGFNLASFIGYKQGMSSIAQSMNAKGIAKEFATAKTDILYNKNYKKMDCLLPFLTTDQAKQAITISAKRGNLNFLRKVFDTHEIDINSFDKDTSPLREASAKGHLDIVTNLLRRGINQTHDRHLSLGDAIVNKHVDIITVLVNHENTINQEDVDYRYIGISIVENARCDPYFAFKRNEARLGRNIGDYFLMSHPHTTVELFNGREERHRKLILSDEERRWEDYVQ